MTNGTRLPSPSRNASAARCSRRVATRARLGLSRRRREREQGWRRPACVRATDGRRSGWSHHHDRGDRERAAPSARRRYQRLIEACQFGSLKVELVRGQFSADSASDRRAARSSGADGQFEAERTRERVLVKMASIAREGKMTGGGNRPFGYEQMRTAVREEEAVLIREARDRVFGGESIRGICADWNTRGIGARRRAATGIRRRLPPRLGQRGYRRAEGAPQPPEPVAATWPAIVSADDLAQLRELLQAAKRTTRGEPRYLLTGGVLRCHRCGERLVARPTSTR